MSVLLSKLCRISFTDTITGKRKNFKKAVDRSGLNGYLKTDWSYTCNEMFIAFSAGIHHKICTRKITIDLGYRHSQY